MRLDFRSIPRFKFNCICRHLQPKQIIELILSDEETLDQIQCFINYFPDFKYQFNRLQTLELNDMNTILLDLPISVSSLSFQAYKSTLKNLIRQTIKRQAASLTHLDVEDINLLRSLDTPFHALTHLTTSCQSFIEFNWIISLLGARISHLHLVVGDYYIGEMMVPNLIALRRSLTHLTLIFTDSHLLTFNLLEQCLFRLDHLIHFTIDARIKDFQNLMNGNRLEQLISQTRIIEFNFRFKYNFSNLIIPKSDENMLFNSFRSLFWLEQKRWFVAFYKEITNSNLIIYSIPYFRPHHVFLSPTSTYPPLSTAPPSVVQHSFYKKQIDLDLKFPQSITPSVYRFNQVNSLCLLGPVLPSTRTLMSFVNLHQIRKLDVSNINLVLLVELHLIFNETPRLYDLILKTIDPLLVLPERIHSFKLNNDSQLIDVNQFCSIVSHIKHLQITIDSEAIMIVLINRLNQY
ncbi:unnamed protein product [Rotaria sordida]|uniref:Uncharacterized protein n=2 Tax=Rotaria sordida TaxID=392033 RepID=A0A819WXE0_9BILA|nr:unnamed protein product [Rotaria sordida]